MDIFTVEFWQGVTSWLRPDMKNIKQAAEAEVTRQLIARQFTDTDDTIPAANPAGGTAQLPSNGNLWGRGWRWCKEKRLQLLLSLSFVIIVFLCSVQLHTKTQPSYRGLHLWYGQHYLPVGTQIASGEVLQCDSLLQLFPEDIRHEPAEWRFVADPGNEIYHIRLHDSTRLCLSSDSELRLCKSYSVHDRRLYLKGEAKLEVFPYRNQELTIQSGQRQISTSGAVLNISAYERSNYQASLAAGAVSTMIDGKANVLVAGNALIQDWETGRISTKTIDSAMVVAWSTGDCYMFTDKTLYEVFAQLERWYNVRIIVETVATGYHKYSKCIYRTYSLKSVMESLRQTEGIEYRFDECGNVHVRL